MLTNNQHAASSHDEFTLPDDYMIRFDDDDESNSDGTFADGAPQVDDLLIGWDDDVDEADAIILSELRAKMDGYRQRHFERARKEEERADRKAFREAQRAASTGSSGTSNLQRVRIVPPLDELMVSNAAKRVAERRDVVSLLTGLGFSTSRAKRLLANVAPSEVEDTVLAERIDALCEFLPRSAVKVLLDALPELVLQYDLRLTLRPKLEVLTRATGLDEERLLTRAPTLLTLSPERVGGRLEELRAALHYSSHDELLPLLRRAPLLLSRSTDRVRDALSFLDAALPTEVDARSLIARQPTLLLSSKASVAKLPAKVLRLQQLTNQEEWESLTRDGGTGVLARAMTLSLRVIERLADSPPPIDGSQRRVATILRLSASDYVEWLQQKAVRGEME